jgi:hypothetical protein
MPKVALPSQDGLAALPDWDALKAAYQDLRFDSEPAENVEKYAVERHELNKHLPNLEVFWRFHIAPATNRPVDTHLRDGISPVVSRMAERSYEIFCNVSDALDELAIVKSGLSPPRYRPCLNVMRFTGDALMLFDGLIDNINTLNRKRKVNEPSVARHLGQTIDLFEDWYFGSHDWQKRREAVVTHRNMLVHHGRPWLHFLPNDDTIPYILRADDCRADVSRRDDETEFLTWERQIRKFKAENQRGKFITLPEACEEVVDRTIGWLNDAYGRVVERLDQTLSKEPAAFIKYRSLWGRTTNRDRIPQAEQH